MQSKKSPVVIHRAFDPSEPLHIPPPPPPPPRCCLLFLPCNWDAETLTELIYCDGELCYVEGEHRLSHQHTKADTHVSKRECNLASCLKSFFNCSERVLYLWPRAVGAGRGENTRGDCFPLCWTLVSVCVQVFTMTHTSAWLWLTDYWIRAALLAGSLITPTNHAVKWENKKVYPPQIPKTLLHLLFVFNTPPPRLDDKEYGSSSWDKGPHSHACGRALKHTHSHAHMYTRAPGSAVIHLSLIPTCQPAPPTVSAPQKVTAFQWLTKAL